MRIVAYILSILLLTLAAIPCSDRLNDCEPETNITEVYAHSHHSDQDDLCSPLCVCNCCSINLNTKSDPTTSFKINPLFIEKESVIANEDLFLSDIYHKIWQPPKIV